MVYKLIILGSGPAGLTAAIYAGRAGFAPLVVEGRLPGGQPMLTTKVENYPGFPEGIDGPQLVAKIKEQAKKFRARFLTGEAVRVDFKAKPKKIFLDNNQLLEALSVIIATGTMPRPLGLPEEKKLIGKGISTCAICDAPFYRGKTVAVVGGGDTALTDALALAQVAKKVYLIHRRNEFRASQAIQKKIFSQPKIQVLYNKVVVKIVGQERLEKIVLTDVLERTRKELVIDGLFLAIGSFPNTEFLANQVQLDQEGFIKVKNNVFTSVEGVFAAGDVVDPFYKQLSVATGLGCMAGVRAVEYLRNQDAKIKYQKVKMRGKKKKKE